MKKINLILLFLIFIFLLSIFTSCISSQNSIKDNIKADKELIKKATSEYPEYKADTLNKNPIEFLTEEGIFLIILNQAIKDYNTAIANEDFELLEKAGYSFFYVYGYTGSMVAKEYLDKIRNYKSKKLEEYIALAQKFEKSKEIIIAATYWAKVLKIDPDNKNAREFFSKNKELINNEIQKYLQNAKKLLENKKYDDAEKLYKTVLLFDPNNIEAKNGIQKLNEEKVKAANDYFNKGKEFFEKKDYKQAQKYFKLALEIGYDKKAINVYLDKIDLILNIDKYYQSCLDAYNKKDYFEAEIFAKKVMDLDPNYKDIKELYNKIKKGIDETLLSWYNQAVELYNQKAYDKALELFQKIAKYNPNYKDIQNYIQSCMAKLQALSSSSGSG
ncbi:MAG: tetratricopeptide repeat protein [Exilispira sp.]